MREGDTLIVWKLDRLGRDLRYLVNTVHDLTAHGIGFKVMSGHGASIDTTSPSGKLVFGIFAALAEFERELIIERTRAGMAAACARPQRRQPQPDPRVDVANSRSDLRHPAVDEQFDACHVAAVVGCKEQRDVRDLVGGAHASERHLSSEVSLDLLEFFLRRSQSA